MDDVLSQTSCKDFAKVIILSSSGTVVKSLMFSFDCYEALQKKLLERSTKTPQALTGAKDNPYLQYKK